SQQEADYRVDDAEEDDVGSISGEVVDTFGQNIFEIGDVDMANLWERRLAALLGPDPGAARRSDDHTGKFELIGGPRDGVADSHVRSSRTARPRGRGATRVRKTRSDHRP